MLPSELTGSVLARRKRAKRGKKVAVETEMLADLRMAVLPRQGWSFHLQELRTDQGTDGVGWEPRASSEDGRRIVIEWLEKPARTQVRRSLLTWLAGWLGWC